MAFFDEEEPWHLWCVDCLVWVDENDEPLLDICFQPRKAEDNRKDKDTEARND